MSSKITDTKFTQRELEDTYECSCDICSSQNEHLFLTASKEDLKNLPALPPEEESELRVFVRELRKRAEEDLEQELLQSPLRSNNVLNNK